MYLAGGDSPIVESLDDLVTYFSEACKPREEWRIGTEHEMLGVLNGEGKSGASVPYSGLNGLTTILNALVDGGWQPIREGENIIALSCRDTQVSIEPGSQLEHAARPHRCSANLSKDLRSFLDFIEAPSNEIGATWISAGFRPWGNIDQVGWIPKYRYNIMREYLPTRGGLAHEMMKRTATVQVNLDYSSEVDARNKMRAMMNTTSILTAIYANSPIVDGKLTDYQSYRGHVWTDMDPDRCGLLELVYEDENFFKNYTEWALDVPLFFVHRDTYVAAKGMTFRQFMKSGFEGKPPTLDDWGLHLSTLFPDGRMKQYLEIRSCDASSFDMTVALGAFSCGYLYDDTAMQNAIELTGDLSMEQRVALADAVNRDGLDAIVPGTTTRVGTLAKELVAIAKDGLSRVDATEIPYLEPIEEVVESGRTHATILAELWEKHSGDPDKILPLLSYHRK